MGSTHIQLPPCAVGEDRVSPRSERLLTVHPIITHCKNTCSVVGVPEGPQFPVHVREVQTLYYTMSLHSHLDGGSVCFYNKFFYNGK